MRSSRKMLYGDGGIANIMIVIVEELSLGAKNSAKVGKGAKKVSSKNLALAAFFLALSSPSNLYYRSLVICFVYFCNIIQRVCFSFKN